MPFLQVVPETLTHPSPKLCCVASITNITGAIKVVEAGRTCSMHSGFCAHKVSVGKPEGKARQGVPTIR